MRSKAEILEKMTQIRQWRDDSSIESLYLKERYKQACNLIILGLRFALGYNIGLRYRCIKCEIYHKNVRCPKCGNGSLIADKGRGL